MINSGAEMCLSVYLVGKRALICFAVFRWVSIKRAEIFNAFFSSSFSTVERPLHWAGNERPQNWLCCESQFVIKTFGEFVDVNTVIIRTELRQWEILKSIRNTRFICNWHVSCFVVQIKHRLTDIADMNLSTTKQSNLNPYQKARILFDCFYFLLFSKILSLLRFSPSSITSSLAIKKTYIHMQAYTTHICAFICCIHSPTVVHFATLATVF